MPRLFRGRRRHGQDFVRIWHTYVGVRDRSDNVDEPMLRVELLGKFAMRTSQHDVRIESPRLRALLADLLLHQGDARPRPHLAFKLWPDSTEKQARTNLRQLLHHLRRALPEPDRFLEVSARTITWRRSEACRIDVAVFEESLRAAARASKADDSQEETEHLVAAADAYSGPLLPECYENWLEEPRADLQQSAHAAFERLIDLLQQGHDPRTAIRYAERLRRLDPMSEDVYRRLIGLYGRAGELAKAREVYDACRTMLAAELGAVPGPQTEAAWTALAGPGSTLATVVASPIRPDRGDTKGRVGKPTDGSDGAAALPLRLVGREKEWARMRSVWDGASRGAAQLLVISGEAGIGKTHLCEVFADDVRRSGATVTSTRCYSAEGRLAYAPVIDWLRSDACRPALESLEQTWLMEVGRLVPDRAAHRLGGSVWLEPVATSSQQRLFEGLCRAFLGAPAPLLLVVDDLQWSDPETLAWLRFFLRRNASARVLVLTTVRVEETDALHPIEELRRDLTRDGLFEEIGLGPLSPSETVALAAHETGRALELAEAGRLVRETEGHPLFIVESIRSGRLQASGEDAASSIPPKVQAVLESRLAQLSSGARAVAELAATAGRSFGRDLLTLASTMHEDAVYQALDELWQRRILRPNGPARYDFAHDRLREAAYRSAGPIRQTLLHRQIARALETLCQDDLDPVASALAVHYDRAGDFDCAIQYYERSGEAAQRVYAHHDASEFFERALEMIHEATAPGRYRQVELRILEALGSSLVSLRNYSDPRVQHVYQRAETICTVLGRPTSAPVLRGLAIAAVMQGDQATVERCGLQLLDLARAGSPGEVPGSGPDPVLLVEAHYVMGVNAFWQGRFRDSKRQLESAVVAYEPSQHHIHVSRYAQDPGLVCGIRLALTELYLGLLDRAFERCAATLAQAEALNHPMSWVYVEAFATWIYLEGRRWNDALETVVRMQARIERHDLSVYWPTVARLYRCAAEVALGTQQWTVEAISAALAQYTLPGAGRAQMTLICAAACGMLDAPEVGLPWLSERLVPSDNDAEPYVRAEMFRVRAGLRTALSAPSEQIDADLDQAERVARSQGALLFELRTHADRLCLRGEEQNASALRAALIETYERFTEGHQSSDLISVRQQIEGLRSA